MAPDDPPAGRRRALLVATAAYGDPGLAGLRAPTGDVASLAAVLGDAAIGGFDVRQLVDRPTEELRREIETFFGDGRPQDLLLLYVSGHGVLSQSRRFYFATADTSLQLLRSTAIEDSFVNDVMQASRARSIVLVLDCCHSGAFGKGLAPKSTTSVDVEHRFEGQGRVTLSASTELEYAFEETEAAATSISELDPAAPGSLFTRSVVEGLRSGDADLDEDGRISVDDLYDYVCRRVRERSVHQTPGMAGDIRGEIVIARSARRVKLPTELATAAESTLAGIREGAVAELAALAGAGSGGLAIAAREALERLADDDSRRVSAAAAAALGRTAPPAPPPPPARPPPVAKPPPEPSPPPSRGPAIAGIAGVAVVAAIAAGILLFGGSQSPPPTAAMPYVFSKDGSAQLVMGVPMGAEFGSDASTGVVLVGATSDPSALTATMAGVPGKAVQDQRFGAAVASGDFDKDGRADLAIGVPGKDGVSVLYGLDIRNDWIGATELENRPKLHDFGATLVAADFNHDGYADLAVSAPGNEKQRRDWDPATLHVLFGGTKGLSAKGASSIEQPGDFKEFGLVMAAGDVDGNGSVDLLEGSPGNPDGTGGHLSFCAGGADGPARCSVKLHSPTSALAVGRITKDRFADVVQGDARAGEDAGELRVWLGGPSWRPRKPTATITQESGRVPGIQDPGNGFGSAVAVGDVTGDRLADIVVTAPNDEGSGTMSLIPGSGDAPRPEDASTINAPEEIPPGGHFGVGLSLLDWDGDPHPDLFVAVGEVDKLDRALVYYTSQSEGGLNANEPQWGTGLDTEAQLNVPSALYIGR
jgi:Caspase domain/FG-GAP repeat